MPNIVEVYTERNKQNIILISGFSGSGKSKFGIFISKIFNIKLTYLSEFYYSTKIYDIPTNYFEKLSGGISELDWDNIYKSVDWITFNDHVDTHKKNGIVIVGFGFPKHLLKFKHDYHIHIKINKQNLFKNRDDYIKSHPDAYAHKHTPEQEKLIFNKITYNHYNKIIEDSDIDKRLNANDKTLEQLYDELFSYLISMIDNWLKVHHQKVIENRPYTKNEPYDGYINTYHQGMPQIYEEVYYNNKRKHPYSFNNEGIDYPDDYMNKHHVSESPLYSSDDTNTSDSDARYLFTTR
jgi:adenylate kinase family enzyme